MRDIFILKNIWVQNKIYILVSTFIDLNILITTKYRIGSELLAVILLPTKVRKVDCSFAEFCVKSVYLNILGWRGREVHETF
jgi:hypothetical protein